MSWYRMVDVRIHGDEKYLNLTPDEPSGRALFKHLLICPENGPLPGVIRAGCASLAEALEWSPERLRERFGELFREGLAEADWKARFVFLPNGIKYNPPANANIISGWVKHWDALPEGPLKARVWARYHEYFQADKRRREEEIESGERDKKQDAGAMLAAFLKVIPRPLGPPGSGAAETVPGTVGGTVPGTVDDFSAGARARLPEPEPEPNAGDLREEKKIAPRPLVSAPPEPADDPLLFEFPCDGDERAWKLRASKVAEWQESYPALDVLAQCRQALQYIRDNPAKRKTARGMPAFLGRWLARSQDNGRASGNGGKHDKARGVVRPGVRSEDEEYQEQRRAQLRERDRLALWNPDAPSS